MAQTVALAVDLGASSGRHVAGLFDGQRLELRELHRFENGPILAAGNMYWDLLRLWTEVQAGLRAAQVQFGDQVRSVGVDTWGVDFGLLGRRDELLGNPVHYRDQRTSGMMERAIAEVTRAEIFSQTGLQFLPINTLYQVMALHAARSPLLDAAETFLMMPDLFHWLLTGVKGNEFSNATTTQFFNPRRRAWAAPLLEKLGIPTKMLGTILAPGTVLGKLRPEVAAATGLNAAEVILPGTHDTASAVLAVPATGAPQARPDWCYISSGTWSLMGVEIPEPVVNDRCLALNFTNEGGVGNTTRLLKNIGGLWLVQECRRIWRAAGKDHTWEQLTQLAAAAEPLRSLVNPDDGMFLAPANMPQAIAEFCRKSGQPIPESPGQVIRCALESLTLKYRQVLGWLEELTGGRIATIQIVGGGTNNTQLSQMTADATQRRVVAGPIEATAIGNILMQLISQGAVGSINEAREIVRRNFPVMEYAPVKSTAWDEAFARFEKL